MVTLGTYQSIGSYFYDIGLVLIKSAFFFLSENYKDLWKVSDNKDFIDQFKDKLDTPKRHMDWRALAIKCKIPRKTFEKFGKPKLGPTEHLFIHVRISKHFESLNVKELKEYLGKMNRFDVLKAIERHKIPGNPKS